MQSELFDMQKKQSISVAPSKLANDDKIFAFDNESLIQYPKISMKIKDRRKKKFVNTGRYSDSISTNATV